MLQALTQPPDFSELDVLSTLVGISRLKDKILEAAGGQMELRAVAIMCELYLSPHILGVKELAGTLGTSRPVITRNVDSLVEREFVTRRHDQEDKRLISLHLTIGGTEWAAAFLKRLAPILRAVELKDHP